MALKKKKKKYGKGISYQDSMKCRKLDEFGDCADEEGEESEK